MGTWRVVILGCVSFLLGVVACAAPGSREAGSMTSRSHVIHADSTRVPLRPVQRIALTVSATATYDVASGLWSYAYSVTNDPASENALETFAVTPVPGPERIVSPPHWMGSYGSEGDSTAIAWSVVDYGPDPPNWNGVQLYQGPYHPRPGQTTSGFGIVSARPPAAVRFYAQGFDTLQVAGEDEYVESAPGVFQEGVTGETIGPGTSSP
jgi:hypothetical protein